MLDSTTSYPNEMRFDLTSEHIEQLANQIIANSKRTMDTISSSISNPSWANTIQPLIEEDSEFSLLHSNCSFSAFVSTDKSIRDSSIAATKKLDAYQIEKDQRVDVYQAVKTYVEKLSQNDNLNDEQRYLLNKIMVNYRHNGLSLPADKLSKLKEIKRELSTLCIEFNQNITEDKTSLLFTREELEGLPDEFIDGLQKNGDKFVVTLQYPDLFPVMKKAKKASTRKALNIAQSTKCMATNVPIFERVVSLRQQEAILIGFPTPAHLILETKMAKNPDTVFQFLGTLCSQLESGLQAELANFLEIKKTECEARGEVFDGKINAWDRLYYDDQVLLRDFQVDQDAISSYFPMDHVVQATLEIYEQLFSLIFLPEKNPHVWHPDVSQYCVYDKDSNEFIGHFYLDLHPREGKYTHAAEFGLQKSCIRLGKIQYPAAAMVANFSKPTPTKPSLLKHDEVVTWAHELGHVLHELLSTATYSYLAGTNVQRDFVEAPSQALENWCFERECLEKLSSHYQTGESLPENLIDALVRSRNANIATDLRRQIFFAKFDMQVHVMTPSDPKLDSGKLWHDLSLEIMQIPPAEGTNPVATFGHLTGGYQAGYYGYLWSKVFASDIFYHIKKFGILNGEIGRIYRKTVLAPGGSKDAMDLLKDFLGREPNNHAFLQQIGLANVE